MDFVRINRIALIFMLLSASFSKIYAEQITKDNVTIVYTPLDDGTIKVKYAENKSSSRVMVYVDGRETTINANGSAQINQIARKKVNFNYPKSSGAMFWRYNQGSSTQTAEAQPQQPVEENHIQSPLPKTSESTKGEEHKEELSKANGTYPEVLDRISQDPFFGTDAVAAFVKKTESFSKGLSNSSDKGQFIIDNDIKTFLSDSEQELQLKRNEIPTIAQELTINSLNNDPTSQARVLNTINELLTNRLNQRKGALDQLRNDVNQSISEPERAKPIKDSIINYSIIGAIILVLAVCIAITLRRRKNKTQKMTQATCQPPHDTNPDNASIVVRRRTTSILKRQSIDDVTDNPEYLLIKSEDFTSDSAVRNIYIKNTCIKDVYNLYSEDLRNSSNPKEDGCMVLGRWICNEESHTYDISLETVVFPGDDAVFKEYELNFGGKIKLRIAERLRKLRRETNLQYDLVCWIHSHPGLGVFFSNSDNNVQMQLRHSQHPNFLVAFVIDILTDTQETGIFTFRKDGTMNSKGDLTKMYSLEDMYKWALESDTASFNADNYYNILQNAKMQLSLCKSLELNNSSIIDLCQILVEPGAGIAGWAIGTSLDTNDGRVYLVSKIANESEKQTTGVIGVLLHETHMSLPTIQRLIANESASLSFALVYSSRHQTLTSIPIVNGELITDENFYGEETIDNLKIWTRRKR